MNDVVLNKIAIIERCINRIKDEYNGHEHELATNFTKQDAILLNIQRTCEASIDLGIYLIKLKKLGLPQSTREIFDILATEKIIATDLSNKLQKMIGFRNIAVHEYQKINLDIVESIIENNLSDLLTFTKNVLYYLKNSDH